MNTKIKIFIGRTLISMLFLVGIITIILVSVYTISYGVYEWKNKNKTGAVAVFAINLATIALAVIRMFAKI